MVGWGKEDHVLSGTVQLTSRGGGTTGDLSLQGGMSTRYELVASTRLISYKLVRSRGYVLHDCRHTNSCCGTWYRRYRRYLWRERNLLALPTLDMYLPLSKFESIHRVYNHYGVNTIYYKTLSQLGWPSLWLVS